MGEIAVGISSAALVLVGWSSWIYLPKAAKEAVNSKAKELGETNLVAMIERSRTQVQAINKLYNDVQNQVLVVKSLDVKDGDHMILSAYKDKEGDYVIDTKARIKLRGFETTEKLSTSLRVAREIIRI